MEILKDLEQAVIDCDGERTMALVKQAIDDGLEYTVIISDGIIAGMRGVGELFNQGTYFLPELLTAGLVVQEALDHIEPFLAAGDKTVCGRMLIGTVKGDIHDIGKNIVGMVMRCNGWEVTDAGVDVTPEQFCAMVKEEDYDVLGMSSLLTMTMPAMDATIAALNEAGLRDKVVVAIGGAPITQDFADKIGADVFGADAWDTLVKCEQLVAARA